ncbi:MAG TPA: SprB repeat-containing protein [Cyclobacteriaceae bacterium]
MNKITIKPIRMLRSKIISASTAVLFSACVYHDSEIQSSVCKSDNLSLKVAATTNASSCSAADGSITVSASGGVSGYTFSINDGAYQSDSVFSNLTIGSYTLSAKDYNGCVVSQIASVNNAESTVALSVSTTANTGCPTANGTLTVSVTGGTEPYQYKINSNAYQSSNTFTGLTAGTYSISVIDSTNCPTTTSATITREGPSFASDINSIITTKCAISGCHNGSKSPNLTTYARVNSNASKIKSEVTNKTMPPSNSSAGSLTQTQINLITCWVNDGALNN